MTAGGVNPPGTGHDEDGLVEAARTDRQAFGVLYDRHFDAIYHYIARRVGDAETAEDIASHVWERALKAIERYEIRGVPFAAWLYRIAGNLVANHHRRNRLLSLVPLLPQHAAAPRHEAADEHAALRTALGRLSPSDQELLCLCYDAGLSPAEIADVLDCTPAAVHKRLHRARSRLRHHLEGTHAAAPSA
ncbi:RNA polymerase subunit sigma-24 [bacterium]|nr:MAG: RNA polymerase subunit sigma-24 [bacterium]